MANNIDEKILEKTLVIAEKFFGTSEDPEQIPITKESFHKFQDLDPNSFLYKLDKGEPVSWVAVLPTSKNLAKKFLNQEISEKELMNMSQMQDKYDAIYLCSAFTVPSHRKKGYALELLKQSIEQIPHTDDVQLFAWPYSKEGLALGKKLEKQLGKKIEIKINNENS